MYNTKKPRIANEAVDAQDGIMFCKPACHAGLHTMAGKQGTYVLRFICVSLIMSMSFDILDSCQNLGSVTCTG